MIATYYDTCCLLKLYFPEPDSKRVLAHAKTADILCCSLLGKAEFAAAAHRKFREGNATRTDLKALQTQLSTDTASGALRWIPITEAHIQRVESILNSAPLTTFLRAADALHLATASFHGFKEIYSNDKHLLAAAPLFGLQGINPIP